MHAWGMCAHGQQHGPAQAVTTAWRRLTSALVPHYLTFAKPATAATDLRVCDCQTAAAAHTWLALFLVWMPRLLHGACGRMWGCMRVGAFRRSSRLSSGPLWRVPPQQGAAKHPCRAACTVGADRVCAGPPCRQWLVNAISTTDSEILQSSGMDAFVMTKALAIGVQLLLPIAFVGCVVCELHCSMPQEQLRMAACTVSRNMGAHSAPSC